MLYFHHLIFPQRAVLSCFAFHEYAAAFKAFLRMLSITFYVERFCSPLASRITTPVRLVRVIVIVSVEYGYRYGSSLDYIFFLLCSVSLRGIR